MKRSLDRLLRRVAAAALGAALLWGAMAPAAPVWAEEQPAPAAQNGETGAPQNGETETDSGQKLILLYQHQTGDPEIPYLTDTLEDGDTIPFLRQVFGEITLCRGDADHPVSQSETTVQLLLNGALVPPEAVQFVPLHESYAQYGVQLSFDDTLSRLLGQASPNFGMELKLTAGGESLTVSILNEGVQVSVPEYINSLTIQSSGPDLYLADLSPSLTGDVLSGISPNMDWIAANMQLTGDIAAYFTDPRVADGRGGLTFTPTDKLAELEAGRTLTGQLTWTGKLDQQSYSLDVSYTNSGWSARWYSCMSPGVEYWYPELVSGIENQLMASQSGSFKLRLYPQNAKPNSGGEPLPLQEEFLTKDLPAGMTAILQPDGVTLLVEYTLTGQDMRDTPWTLTANLPGMSSPEVLEIRVKPAPAYWLGSFNMDPSLPPYSYRYNSSTSLQVDTLYEYNAVIPLVDGRPAATREELEQSGVTVADSADPELIQAVPRQLNFTDSIGKTSQVWGFCVSALAENAMNESRSLAISRGNAAIATLPYTLNGMDNSGRSTALQSDRLETLQVSDQARQGTIYGLRDDSGTALPLTAAPTVTGTAAQNLTVVWKEGLSGFRVDLNADQVPGEATVEVRAGSTVRRIVYTFIRYPASATYYSSGLDGSYRNYTESLQFTGDLAGVSGKNPQPVQTVRFAEDGSFDIYLYSQQYIAAENKADPTRMDRYYSFAAELVDSIQFYTSDPEVLRIEGQITHSEETDGAFPGNGYANPEGNCFGVTLTPGGKSGSCEVYAVIRLKRPSANDPFGCDMSKTPETVTIGHTFTVQTKQETATVTAGPDTLQQVLDSISMTSTPCWCCWRAGSIPWIWISPART